MPCTKAKKKTINNLEEKRIVDRSFLKDKKRIVIKIGTSTITHMGGEKGIGDQGTSPDPILKAGLCGSRPGKINDDLPEAVCGV